MSIDVPSVGSSSSRMTGDVRRPPTFVRQFEHRCRRQPERRAQLLEQIGQWIVRADERRRRPGQCCGFGPRRGGLARSSRGAIDQEADHDRDQHEHRQGDDVLGLADGDGVQRRSQEPVGQAEGRDRGDEPGAQTSQRGDRHHQAQVEHQRGADRDVPPNRDQDRCQQRQPDDAQHPRGCRNRGGRAGRSVRRRQRFGPAARRPRWRRCARRPSRFDR